MRLIEKSELEEILKKHQLWLSSNKTEGMCADLHYTNMQGAALQFLDLRGANLNGADLFGADLYNANLQNADLHCADLRYANLRIADLRNANLSGTNMRGTDMSDANLRDANLRGANLHNANLYNANIQNADLNYANLRSAVNIGCVHLNLIGKDIDFCTIPLSCNGLNWKIDRRIFSQLAYHICSHECEDEEVKKAQNALLKLANEFHRAERCGILKKR